MLAIAQNLAGRRRSNIFQNNCCNRWYWHKKN